MSGVASPPTPLSLIAYLEERLASDPPKTKGARTKERLRIAVAGVLEQKGYHDMRVVDVTEAAGLAEGSFYMYFKDKSDAALDVLTTLLHEIFARPTNVEPDRTAFAAIRQANRHWLSLCRQNAGLMRCLLQVGDELPAFAHLVQQASRQWCEFVVAGLVRRQGETTNRPGALLAVFLLGAMMDEIARKLVVYPDPEFHKLLIELGADDDAVADAASIVWMRVLYPKDAIPPDLPRAATVLAALSS